MPAHSPDGPSLSVFDSAVRLIRYISLKTVLRLELDRFF